MNNKSVTNEDIYAALVLIVGKSILDSGKLGTEPIDEETITKHAVAQISTKKEVLALLNQ